MKRKSSILILMLVFVVGMFNLGLLAQSDEDTVTVCLRSWDYDTIDPHVTNFTQVGWMTPVFTDTLVSQDVDGNFYPGLAKSWESKDLGKVWIFHLREGVKFHDGTPWNAEAMIENIDRVLDPATQSKFDATLYEDVETYEAVDPMTVRLVFSEPKATFLQKMADSFMGWLSPTAFNNPENKKISDKLVGSGPWVLVDEQRGQRIEFRKNEDYNWAPEFFEHQGPPYIEKLVFRFVEEDETRFAGFLKGEFDLISEVPTTQIESVKKKEGFRILSQKRPGIAQVHHLNVTKSPTDELAVRRAIIYATDQESIVQAVFQGVHPPAYGLLMPASPYYNEEIEDMYPYSPEKAKQLLEEAGWVDSDNDGIREKNGEELELIFQAFPGYLAERPAEMVQAMLRQVGVKFDVNVVSGSEMMTTCAKDPSPIHSCVVGQSGVGVVQSIYQFGHSNSLGTNNYPHVDDAEIDQLINIARTTPNEAVRETAMKEVQRLWMKNALSNPIFAISNTFGVNNRLQNITFDITHVGPVFYDAEIVE